MDCFDLNKATCRICIIGGETNRLINLFTKKINETASDAIKLIDDDYVLNMSLSEALESFTCVEFQQYQGLPETICRKCEFQLIETLIFIHRANNTQKILNSYSHNDQEVMVKTEDIDVNEESSYQIEVLNDEGEVIQDEYVEQLCEPESRNGNEESNDCGLEDAVSFLKSVKKETLVCATSTCSRKSVSHNYSCNYCQRMFLRKSNLVTHMMIHANKRPFNRTSCSESFAHPGNLESHLCNQALNQKSSETSQYNYIVSTTEHDPLIEPIKNSVATKKSKSRLSKLSNQAPDSMVLTEGSSSSTELHTTGPVYCSSFDDAQANNIDDAKPRRLPRIKRNWELHKKFENGNDAKEFVKSEKIWSIATTNQTVEGVKVLYRCNKAKGRGRQCECAIYLLYLLESDAVLLYRTQNGHTCLSNPRTYNPISDEIKEKIIYMFKRGIRKRKQIQNKLESENCKVPSLNQLNNLINECRQRTLHSKRKQIVRSRH